MTADTFVDTNILIYAHDVDAGIKHSRAQAAVMSLWNSRAGIVSPQVLQEFYVNVTRKIATPLPRADARELIEAYAQWQVAPVGAPEVLLACRLEERHQLSFWDALIVAAAQRAGARRILSEDFAAGRVLDDIRMENPLTA
jgi:predicted nucleic acid-binding protein